MRKRFTVGQIVKVVPDKWRDLDPFIGKVREITQSGAYVSRMKGKRYANITNTYYGDDEIERTSQNQTKS